MPDDALRKQAAFASRRQRTSPVCFRKESESTMSNEKPKHASIEPPGNTFRIECRPRNLLVPVILLSLREWNSYGYELMGRVRMFGFEAMNTGTLYRTLRRMEKDGDLESSWETCGGGPDVHHRWLWQCPPGHLGEVFWSDTSRAWTTSSGSIRASLHMRARTKPTSRGLVEVAAGVYVRPLSTLVRGRKILRS
jgi:poly-beta-hydroxybutyrate-responsive repressor